MMRPVTVYMPTAARIRSRKVVSTTAITFDFTALIKEGERTLVFVAGAADVYATGGATAAAITAPVIATVDGGTEAERCVPLFPVGVLVPIKINKGCCVIKAIAAATSHLTVFEA